MRNKYSSIKNSILALLSKTKSPLSVAEIMEIITANKTTVYRDLASLINDGLVKELDFGDRTKRYETSSLGHHHHLICRNCKKIEEVKIKDVFEDKEKDLEKRTGFKSIEHNLEFYGTCAKCLRDN